MKYCLVAILAALAAIPSRAESSRSRVSIRTAAESNQPTGAFLGPVMGLVSNADRTEVRALAGVPGASLVSDPVQVPESLGRIYLAPAQAWGLAERADGSGLSAVFFDSAGTAGVSDIANTFAGVSRIGFAPSGRVAIVYSKSAGRLHVIARTGDSATVTMDIDVASVLSAHIAALAIDDAGRLPVVITGAGEVCLVGADTSVRVLHRGQTIVAAGYLRNSDSLFLAESEPAQISIVDSVSDVPSARVLASGFAPGGSGIWAQPSLDSRFLFVAADGANVATRIDLASGLAQILDLPSKPTGLERLRNGNSFLLSSEPGAPAWILLGDEPDLRAVFVARPAEQPDETQPTDTPIAERRGAAR